MYAREPLVVAFPRDADDVAAAIAAAGRFDVPVVRAARAPASPARPPARGSCSTPRATWTRSAISTRRRCACASGPAWCRRTSTAPRSRTGSASARTPQPRTGRRSAGHRNNSCSKPCVVYGSTRRPRVALQRRRHRGRLAPRSQAIRGGRQRARRARADTLAERSIAACRRSCASTATRSRRLPHPLAPGRGATPRPPRRRRAVRPRALRRRLGGHTRSCHRGHRTTGSCPAVQVHRSRPLHVDRGSDRGDRGRACL